MPADIKKEERRFVMVMVKLPLDLAEWLDLHLAELRLAMLRNGRKHVPAPNRSSFIREQLQKARLNGNGPRK